MTASDATGSAERGYHDLGGLPAGPIDRHEHALKAWERRTDALLMLLTDNRRRILRVDESRRIQEMIGREAYERLSYYGRWIAGMSHLLVEKGVFDRAELERKLAEVRERLAR